MGFDYDACIAGLEKMKVSSNNSAIRAEEAGRSDIADIHRNSITSTDETINACMRIRDSQNN